MAGSRDIRSFFGGAPVKKKQKVADTSAATEITVSDAAAETQTVVAAATKAADGQQEKSDELTVTTEAAAAVATANDAADGDDVAPLTHSFQNLRRNVKVLMHPSWYEQLENEFTRPYFVSLTSFLTKEANSKKTIYPPPQDVFSALRDCSFSSLKVVILGQDPYHGPEQAHGLSFSVRRGIPPPPSLKNIYKEAMSDVKISKPTHGCLSSWSQQGVLLLNTVLTVRKGEPNSHKKQGWETLTDAIIQRINNNTSNVVFLLWGKPAQEKGAIINTKKHLVVKSSHPSPLGATKTNAPFIGSKCFSKANEYLIAHGKDPIDWNVL
uniref:Uracil-DNA glycosylase n=1 Tax=Globisporangium ultimum (strain ATCC 200006 / CBS 805.95 / DAOM BR144) TaxID=431595 RepID=K3X359_GLOUD